MKLITLCFQCAVYKLIYLLTYLLTTQLGIFNFGTVCWLNWLLVSFKVHIKSLHIIIIIIIIVATRNTVLTKEPIARYFSETAVIFISTGYQESSDMCQRGTGSKALT